MTSDTQFQGDTITEEYKLIYDEYGGWLNEKESNQNTIDRRLRGAKRYLNWCANNGVDAAEVEQGHIEDYIDDSADLSANSLSSSYDAVVLFYDWWMRGTSGIDRESHPCTDIDFYENHEITTKLYEVLSRDGRKDAHALSKDTIEALFPYADEDGARTQLRNETILRLLWDTALRCDEMSRIEVDNITWGDREIEIRSSKLNQDDDLYYRKVYFTKSTERYLRLWVYGGRESLSNKYNDSAYLFFTTHNPQMRPEHISRIAKKAAFRHDQDPDTDDQIQTPLYTDGNGYTRWLVTGHRFRHSRISYLANQTNMPLKLVRDFAGHKQFQTTLDYVKQDWDELRDAYQRAIGEYDGG